MKMYHRFGREDPALLEMSGLGEIEAPIKPDFILESPIGNLDSSVLERCTGGLGGLWPPYLPRLYVLGTGC